MFRADREGANDYWPGDAAVAAGAAAVGATAMFLFEHRSTVARLAALGAGGAALGYGLHRRGRPGWPLFVAGGLLCARAITPTPAKRAGRREIDVKNEIVFGAPVHRVFSFFCDLEAFPRILNRPKAVEGGGGRSHRKAAGPGGIPVRWNAQITAFERDDRIAWKSIPGTPTPNAGVLRVHPVDGGKRTRVEVRMSFTPPGGLLARKVAGVFRTNSRRAIDRELLGIKVLLETGTSATPPSCR